MTTALPPTFARSRLQLMLRHPYLANAVARLPVVDASDMEWCETMATDGYYIYINPDFCKELSEEELTAVVAHEVLHCVLGHIDRRGVRDRQLWNVAIDYAVNLLLVDAGFQLPKKGLLSRHFRGMTAEDIYDSLKSEKDSQAQGKGSENGTPDTDENIDEKKCAPEGFDAHVEPGDIEGAATRAGEYPSERERVRIRAALGKELKAKLPGREAGYCAEEIKRAGSIKVSWQQLLARFFTVLRRDDYRSFPFNRKHLWREIYLPSMGTPGPDHIVIAVDTSGSMTAPALSQALAEIDALRATANCSLTLIQCDVVIQSVLKYDPWELTNRTFNRMQVLGRGVTSLIPPFAWVNKNILKAGNSLDALIYITDGYGSFPKQAPGYPVLWLVPESGFENPPFGQLIRI